MAEHQYTRVEYGNQHDTTQVSYNPLPDVHGTYRMDDSSWSIRVTDRGVQIVNPCGSPVGTMHTIRNMEMLAGDIDDQIARRRRSPRRTYAEEQLKLEACVSPLPEESATTSAEEPTYCTGCRVDHDPSECGYRPNPGE